MARRGFSIETPKDASLVSERVAKAEADNLEDFKPRAAKQNPSPKLTKERTSKKRQEDGWPSREARTDAKKEASVQLHIHGPQSVAARFNAMCKDDRRSRWAMLEILMDSYESKAR